MTNHRPRVAEGFQFERPLADWWIWLGSGEVVRVWGTELRTSDDELIFAAAGGDPLEEVQLASVSIAAVDRVVRGKGVNGEPREATPEAGPVVWCAADTSPKTDPL